jgi:glycosyltransferase involved in cell wall biosynthesis
MQRKISIIIPIYNVEEYVEDCILSVINQTYRNLEIILVNDGSVDNSEYICERYKEKDERIIIVNQENGGLSRARNAGLEIATGELIGFVDGDDYVDLKYYEYVESAMSNADADIGICGFFFAQNKIDYKEVIPKADILTPEMGVRKLLEDREIRNHVWTKVIKKELFQDIRFPDGEIYEDICIMHQLLMKANRIVTVNKPLYHYVQRESSISSLKYLERGVKLYQMMEKQWKDIVVIYPNLEEECAFHEFRYLIGWRNECRYANEKELMVIANSKLLELYKMYLNKSRFKRRVYCNIQTKMNSIMYVGFILKKYMKKNIIKLKSIGSKS